MDALKELINKIPVIPILICWVAWLGWDYYEFQNDPGREYQQKLLEIKSVQDSNKKLIQENTKVKEFLANLEATKVELRNAALKLDSFKATISDRLDVADFTKQTTTEARKVGLTVVSIRPMEPVKKEYYVEQPFEFAFRGAFVQLVYLLDRLAEFSKVVRVDNFEIRPVGSSLARIVELQGNMQIKAYKYQDSEADTKGKDAAAAAAAAAATAAASAGAPVPGKGAGK